MRENSKKASPSSTPKKIWYDIKLLTSIPHLLITVIESSETVLSDSIDIEAIFAKHWSQYSDDGNFSEEKLP